MRGAGKAAKTQARKRARPRRGVFAWPQDTHFEFPTPEFYQELASFGLGFGPEALVWAWAWAWAWVWAWVRGSDGCMGGWAGGWMDG